MRKRILAVLATASVALGLAVGLTMPESHADVLPNGYDVSCVNNNNGVAICTITGCPRVHEDLAGDVGSHGDHHTEPWPEWPVGTLQGVWRRDLSGDRLGQAL